MRPPLSFVENLPSPERLTGPEAAPGKIRRVLRASTAILAITVSVLIVIGIRVAVYAPTAPP